ncbi:MAG TPA: DsbA family oxidoreductase [Candidatus Saccharimonadales bacterium]|nr:DsbA family oxidoreductase [Candidatus Saccharimonadales bacterium]
MCPWCYIGKRRMEEALRQLPFNTVVSRLWHPFQLNSDMPRQGLDRKAYRSKKFGSWEQSQAMDAQVTAAGKTVGIEFRYDLQTHTPNTFDSHRLVWLAGASGVQDAVVEALFRAYFCEGANFSNQTKLIEVGASAGMDAVELKRFFASEAGASAVREEEQRARILGISGVPFYVINESVSFSGAQPAETFLDALRRTKMPDKKPADAGLSGAAQVCGPDGCEVPR